MCKFSACKGAFNSNFKTREVVGRCQIASLLSLNFYVLLALFFQPSAFLNMCIINTLFHFLLCQSCRSLRNVSLAGPHIPFRDLIKRSTCLPQQRLAANRNIYINVNKMVWFYCYYCTTINFNNLFLHRSRTSLCIRPSAPNVWPPLLYNNRWRVFGQ